MSLNRAIAKASGKRVGKSFLAWFEGKTERLLKAQITNLGSRKTLDGNESRIREEFSKI